MAKALKIEIIKTGFSVVAVVPTLTLVLGSNLNPMDIEEGDDVYFECNVEANPAAYKIVWKHNVSTVFSTHSYSYPHSHSGMLICSASTERSSPASLNNHNNHAHSPQH